MPERKFTSLVEEVKQFANVQSRGLMKIISSTNVLKCEGPIHVRMTMCLNCNGVKHLGFPKESGSSSRIGHVSLQLGEKLDTPVCKCNQEISEVARQELKNDAFRSAVNAMQKPDPIPVADQVGYGHNAPMPGNKANDFQIGGQHYRSKMQHWDYVVANEIPYLEAMVIKYLTRWRKKNGHQDVRKAYHFLLKLAETEGIDLYQESATDTAGKRYVDQDPTSQGMAGGSMASSQGRGF